MGQEHIEYRVTALESSVGEIKQAVKSIDESLQTLAKLEAHHAETRDGLQRAFETMKEMKKEQGDINKDVEGRLRDIQSEMPVLKLIKTWVIRGVLGTVSIVGTTAVALMMVLRK